MDNLSCTLRIPLISGRFSTHKNLSALGRIFMRVTDKVCKDLTYTNTVCPDRGKLGRQAEFNILPFIFHLSFCGAHNFIYNIWYVDRFIIQTQASHFDLGIIVQVRNQGRHAFHVGADRAEKVGLHFVDLTDRPCRKQLSIALDGSHWVLQLMRHEGYKVTLR